MHFEGFELDVEPVFEALLVQVHLQLYICPYTAKNITASAGPALDGPPRLAHDLVQLLVVGLPVEGHQVARQNVRNGRRGVLRSPREDAQVHAGRRRVEE